MKRIVIACDGTWKRVDSRAADQRRQAGAGGAAGGAGRRAAARVSSRRGRERARHRLAGARGRPGARGLFGQGLAATLAEAYRFLVFNYAPGDEVLLFGFSRGAYTARSLAGLMRNCGIVERAHAAAIPEALALYRARAAATGPDSAAGLRFRARAAAQVTTGAAEPAWRAARGLPPGVPLTIAYLGVWDTVGALGLPGHLRLAGLVNRGLGVPRHGAVAGRAGGAARGGDRRAAPGVPADALG